MRTSRPGFPEFLRQAMRDASLTQAELARIAGVKDSTVSRWLSGKTVPELANIRAMARALGVGFVDLALAAGQLTDEDLQVRGEPRPADVRRRLHELQLRRRQVEASGASREVREAELARIEAEERALQAPPEQRRRGRASGG